MSSVGSFTLSKEERICSRKLIEKLFNGSDSQSLASFPLRVVYLLTENETQDVPVKMMVSVSKRHFKQAVKRNRVKRQVREAYRLQKLLITEPMATRPQQQLLIAFIWLADELYTSDEVAKHVAQLLNRIVEKLWKY